MQLVYHWKWWLGSENFLQCGHNMTFWLWNGAIYRQFYGDDGNVEFYQLLVPKAIQSQLIKLVHEKSAGHLNVKKSQSQLKVRFYWYGWKRHTEIVCRCCKACNEYFRGAMPRHGFLQDMRVGAPMERLQIDLTSSHPRSSKDGFVYIFTCMCAFT